MSIPDWYRSALDASEALAGRQIFFVVGCQKSGTTWVQHLLDGHPHVACHGEGHFTDLLLIDLSSLFERYQASPRMVLSLDPRDRRAAARFVVERVLAGHLARKADPGTVRAVGDRTPEAALGCELLDLIFPDARFIHVIRDGRDGVVSGWAHLHRSGRGHPIQSVADYAELFARAHWCGYITAARKAAAVFPERYLEVRYEDLHARPHSEVRKLLRLLDVADDDETVARCVEAGSFVRLSGGRRRGEEDPASQFRKGVVGDWRERLDAETVGRFEAVAGPLLVELGYGTAATVTA